MLDLSVNEFIERLSSREAVPGGGGASALVGAISIALGHMVGELTVGKKKYMDVEEEIYSCMAEADHLQDLLTSCVAKDAVAFEPLSKAYAIPKDAPDRDMIMEQCLFDAAMVPLEIMKLSCRVIDLLATFAEKGSLIAISDAATGAAFIHGGLRGAAMNVLVNTKSMKNRDRAKEIDDSVVQMLDEYLPKADEIYKLVWERFE